MENKILTVAIIGCGSRGCESYGRIMFNSKDKYDIIALCDANPKQLEKAKNEFNVKDENCFLNDDDFLSKKRADLIVIATQDQDHINHCLKALKVGYDILLEKPITDKIDEVKELLKTQKKYGGKVIVCHVLRYGTTYVKVNQLLKENTIGKLIGIQAIEQVHYWHQAHSYVRGNWRNSSSATPMILAKCCHDLDLLQFFAKSKCKSISSIGDLAYFKEENAPEGCANRCLDCKYVDSCPYSAKNIYLKKWKEDGSNPNEWPSNVITLERPLTEDNILEAIKTGPYGRCVFHCDNNVVDHQFTQMEFENGVKASLLMTGFTGKGGRIYKFYGTLGEIDLDEENEVILVKKFGCKEERYEFKALCTLQGGHGGGDQGLIKALYENFTGEQSFETSLEASIESHLMGIYAEKSRLENGKLEIIDHN